MKRKFLVIIVSLVLIALASSACFPGIPTGGVDSEGQAATQDAIILQAVQSTATTMAMLTQISQLETQVAKGGAAQPPAPTNTGQATVVAGATTEATFTATPPAPTATNTPVPPTDTPVPPTATQPAATATLTSTAIPCNLAQFVSDITIADGSTIGAGTTFTKTWRLKNVGACTWTTSYDLVFVNGDQMSAPSVVDMPGNVANGQVIDLSVTMVAPSSAGKYRGNWKLRDASGVLFGVGTSSATFYVDIRVATPSTGALDFIAHMCDASWSNSLETLPCPGINNDARGFALRIDNPTLESGYVDDEPVLQMFPRMVTDGLVRGRYPTFHVDSGEHFVSTIGCAYKATDCNVIFRLDYVVGSDPLKTLASWHEVYDNAFHLIDVDLSSLVGKDVQFQLTVLANGSYNQDRAQWLLPRIVKK